MSQSEERGIRFDERMKIAAFISDYLTEAVSGGLIGSFADQLVINKILTAVRFGEYADGEQKHPAFSPTFTGKP